MNIKVMTILGTRPEIIRLSLVIKKLDQYCKHILVYTGQNYDDRLSTIFFKELGVRKPDYDLGITANTIGEQIGKILMETEKVILAESPDRILILGDTNSGLASIIARRMKIPVFHMEAGNRCFDLQVPEETNRKIIDHCSTILLPYTYRSKENLLMEGIANEKIYVTGNPIYEVMQDFSNQINSSQVLSKLKLQPEKYFLVTMHREENVDNELRCRNLFSALESIYNEYHLPIMCSIHPRTKDKLAKYSISPNNKDIIISQPFGFFDFIALEKNALCIITDSGTVQEECCILRKPNITIRDVTERPETIECGSNMLAGAVPDLIVQAVKIAVTGKKEWQPPPEYLDKDVSSKVIKIILGLLRASAQ